MINKIFDRKSVQVTKARNARFLLKRSFFENQDHFKNILKHFFEIKRIFKLQKRSESLRELILKRPTSVQSMREMNLLLNYLERPDITKHSRQIAGK